MGCAKSKEVADPVDPKDVQLQSSNDPNDFMRHKTKSGFHSDVESAKNTTIGEQIVHENMKIF